jgi:hypothetical protein
MRLFKRKKTSTAKYRENALAMQVAGYIQRKQTQVSGYLNRKTQYWNRASKLAALFLFCLLFGGFCLFMLIKAIIHL